MGCAPTAIAALASLLGFVFCQAPTKRGPIKPGISPKMLMGIRLTRLWLCAKPFSQYTQHGYLLNFVKMPHHPMPKPYV
jgi:hypothetical protein